MNKQIANKFLHNNINTNNDTYISEFYLDICSSFNKAKKETLIFQNSILSPFNRSLTIDQTFKEKKRKNHGLRTNYLT